MGEDIIYYGVGSSGKIIQDTTNSIKNQQADTADKLLGQDIFTYGKVQHILKAYTSDNHAPVDGGNLYYTLDSLGIIYIRGTTWPGFSRLKSNNDSINDLINQAFGHILVKPQLHCYKCSPCDTSANLYDPPPMPKDE